MRTCAAGTVARMRAAAAAALPSSREAIVTSAPARASSRTVYQPMPLLPPVTIARLPVWSGMSRVVHWSLMNPLSALS